MYTIRVETVFAAGHALRLPDGTLEPLHGHNWTVGVTVGCADEALDAIEAVMDFHELERLVGAAVEPFENAHLNDVEPFVSAFNPSAERVAYVIAQAVASGLPEAVRLIEVAVGEAPGCTATYRPH